MISDDVHWCALTLGEQKRQLKEIHHGDEWSDKVSILVYNLTYDKVDNFYVILVNRFSSLLVISTGICSL